MRKVPSISGYVGNFQHGFRRNHSCETQLLNTVEELSRRLDMRQTIDLLILDFSKAFDAMPHRRLLHKIQHYGVEGLTNKWIGSWLCQRKQKVVLDGYSSEESSVISGVCRQGTVLGPLMFLHYVNDIADHVKYLHKPESNSLQMIVYCTGPLTSNKTINNYNKISTHW
jgi:methylaspartate ammonia-lyase